MQAYYLLLYKHKKMFEKCLDFNGITLRLTLFFKILLLQIVCTISEQRTANSARRMAFLWSANNNCVCNLLVA